MHEQKGDDLCKKAEKSVPKIAIDLYNKAGIQYKLANKWLKAANVLEAASQMQETKMGNRYESALLLIDSADCYLRESDEVQNSEAYKIKAVKCYKDAVKILEDDGKLYRAACTLIALGGIYKFFGDFDCSIESYKEAINFLRNEGNNKSKIIECLENLSHLYVTIGNFEIASDNYKAAALECIDNKLLNFFVAKYLIGFVICRLRINDAHCSRDELEQFTRKYPTIINDDRLTFMDNLIDSYIKNDKTEFLKQTEIYKNFVPYDQLLLVVLEEIEYGLK